MNRTKNSSKLFQRFAAFVLLTAVLFATMGILPPTAKTAFAADESSETVNLDNYLVGKRIGVQQGTTGDTIATKYEKKNDGTKVERYNKAADAVMALKQGKIDSIILDEVPTQYFLAKNSDIKQLDGVLQTDSYAMCVKKGNKDLLDKLNTAMDELRADGTFEKIEKNYLGSDDEKGKNPYEKKNVQRNGTLVVATNAEFPPYEYFDNGVITGLDMDMCQAICDKAGMELKIENMAFDSIITAISTGKADVGAAGMTVTEDRKKNVDFTQVYTECNQVVMVQASNAPISAPTEESSSDESVDLNTYLVGKKIGVQQGTTGDTIATEYEKKNDGTKVERYNKAADAVQALKQGKIDSIVLDEVPTQFFLQKNKDIKQLDGVLQTDSYAMCVKKGNKDLLDKINTAMDELRADGTFEQIEKNYLGSDDEKGKTPYTKKDVKRNGTLVVATNAEFPPYEYFDNGVITGLDMDMCQAICDKLGMELKIENMAFDSIITAISTGKADVGAAGMTVTEDRKKNVDFTQVYTECNQVVIVQGSNDAAAVAENGFMDKIKQDFVDEGRWNYLLQGLINTLEIALLAVILGLVLGSLIAVVRAIHDLNGKLKILNVICKIYLTIIRGTPAMIQLLIIYYVIFAAVDVNKIIVAVVAFGLNSAAYIAEIIRSGINAVDKGQFEAGRSLGLSNGQTIRLIVLPQAFRNILPALGNEFISLLKETAISGYIGLNDLTKGGDIIRSQTFDAMIPLFAVALIYLAIVMLLSFGVNKLERKLKNNETR